MENDPQVLSELRAISELLRQQRSPWRTFVSGLIYGIGFVIGSAIIATLLIGLFSPYISQIPFVRALYQSGSAVITNK